MNLKRVNLMIVVACFTLMAQSQVCMPDTSQTVAGMYPSSAVNIPPGCPGQPYQTSITLVVPADTTVFGFLYNVDSAILINVTGLPAGLAAICTPPSCLWLGGTYGCILISGILPPGGGSFPLSFSFSYHASGPFGPISLPQEFPNQYVLNVDSVPVADFSANPSCVSDTTAFVDNSTANATSWIWEFGDGSPTSASENPNHVYTAPGIYNVCLIAMNACGADTICKLVTVAGVLIADAGNDETIYLGNSTTLGGAPPAAGGTPPYSYVWLPGTDLDNQFISNPVTNTSVDISYVLFITDAAGCSAQDTVWVNVDTTSCDTIPDLWTSNIKYNGAKLNWVSVPNVYSYIIQGREVGAANWRTLRLPNGHPTQRTVFGLENNTTYEWQVRAQCDEEGELVGAWSALDSFTTGCFAPDTIWESNVTNSSAFLQWSPVIGVAGYEINGRILGSPTWQVKLQGPYFNLKAVNNLAPSVTYEWRVRSICEPDSVVSAWTATNVFTTPPIVVRLGKEQPGVQLFPNPATEMVTINPGMIGMVDLKVLDSKGTTVQKMELDGSDFVSLDISELQSGMYFVQLLSAEETRIQKLLISK